MQVCNYYIHMMPDWLDLPMMTLCYFHCIYVNIFFLILSFRYKNSKALYLHWWLIPNHLITHSPKLYFDSDNELDHWIVVSIEMTYICFCFNLPTIINFKPKKPIISFPSYNITPTPNWLPNSLHFSVFLPLWRGLLWITCIVYHN